MPVALQQSHCVCIIIHCNNSHSLWFRARRITGILNRSGLVPISDLAGPYLVPISEKSGPYLVPIRDFFQYAWSCHHCVWYVVVFSFSFFRGREGKRGKACIGSLSKSRIHGFTIFLMHIVAESHHQGSLCKKPHVNSYHRSEEDRGRSHRQTHRSFY